MDWNTASVLTAQRRAELARDAALLRAGRAVRNRKARKGVDDGQVKCDVVPKELVDVPSSARSLAPVRDLAEGGNELAVGL